MELVHIHTAAAVIDAELIVGTLRARGIRVFAKGTGSETFTEAAGIGQMTRIPGPLNDIRIMVHPDDEMEAREILADADRSVPDVEPSVSSGAWLLDPANRRLALRVFAVVILFPIVYGVVAGLMEVLRNL